MITLPLVKSELRVMVDDEDAERLQGRRFYLEDIGYALTGGTSRQKRWPVRVHTLLLGRAPKGFVVDHIDGNKLNNCRSNLRVVRVQRNQVNRHVLNRNNASGVRGVLCLKNGVSRPWKATICVNYRTVNLGYFASIEEATRVRRAAELQYFGEPCPVPNKAA